MFDRHQNFSRFKLGSICWHHNCQNQNDFHSVSLPDSRGADKAGSLSVESSQVVPIIYPPGKTPLKSQSIKVRFAFDQNI